MVKQRIFNGKKFTFRLESNNKSELEKNKKYLQKRGSEVRITTTNRKKRLDNRYGYYGAHKGKVYILWSRRKK